MTLLGRNRPGEHRILYGTAIDRDRATRVEPAAARDRYGVRRLSLQDLRLPSVARVASRDDREQRLRIRVLRVSDHRRCGPFLHDPAEVHHCDPLREAGRCREVVRDHQDREAQLAQAVEDVEHACPHRDVEHRNRLVCDEHFGLEDERRGDRDPLALAARELVRITVEEELGR